MKRSIVCAAIAAGLALAPACATAADPILMFLIGFVQNRVSTLADERPAGTPTPSAQPAPPPVARLAPKPIAELRTEDLHALVDESFGYLSRGQRRELVEGLEHALADPANAPHRINILTQFLQVAQQVRHAHDTLDRLTHEQKRLIAVQFTRNFRELAPDQQSTLSEQLRRRALPVPADLGDMMLAELSAAR